MSRYTCHHCKEEHGTENMVAYCAVCFAAKDETIKRLQAELKDDCTWCEDRFTRYDKEVAALESRLKAAKYALRLMTLICFGEDSLSPIRAAIAKAEGK